MTKPKPHQAACEFCGRQFLRIKSPYCPECRKYLHNLDSKKRYHKEHAVSEEDFARRMEGVTERRELVAHFVGAVPGADEDAPYFVGRKLYWTLQEDTYYFGNGQWQLRSDGDIGCWHYPLPEPPQEVEG